MDIADYQWADFTARSICDAVVNDDGARGFDAVLRHHTGTAAGFGHAAVALLPEAVRDEIRSGHRDSDIYGAIPDSE